MGLRPKVEHELMEIGYVVDCHVDVGQRDFERLRQITREGAAQLPGWM